MPAPTRRTMSAVSRFCHIWAFSIRRETIPAIRALAASLHQVEEVPENHRDSDGAHAAGDGGKESGFVGTRGVDVAQYFFVELARTSVDERNTFFNVLGLDETRITRARNDDIGVFEVFDRTLLKREHGDIRTEAAQKPCRWSADEPPRADDDCFCPGNFYSSPFQYLYHCQCSRRMHEALALRNFRIQCVHILFLRHRGQYLIRADMRRKRELRDDGVGIMREPVNGLQYLSGIALLWQIHAHHFDAEPLGGARLDAHERFDDRICSDDDDAEPHLATEPRKLRRQFQINALRNCFAVNYHRFIDFLSSAIPSSRRMVGSQPRSFLARRLSASVCAGSSRGSIWMLGPPMSAARSFTETLRPAPMLSTSPFPTFADSMARRFARMTSRTCV